MSEVQKGDYVLATKFSDGDPSDRWVIGFFSHVLQDRYMVVDARGQLFCRIGFRRIKKISRERGEWLLANRIRIEFSNTSMWRWVNSKMDHQESKP